MDKRFAKALRRRWWAFVGAATVLASCGRTELEGQDLPMADGCRAPLTLCSADCVDVRHDPKHCGGCDRECASLQLCEAGACVDHCAKGLLACTDERTAVACVDPATDPRHCGSCERACPESGICSQGDCLCDGIPCGFDPMVEEPCPAPLSACLTESGAAECIDLQTSRDHCGACDVDCSAGSECIEGQCKKCEPYAFHVPVAHQTGPMAYQSNLRPLVVDVDVDGDLDVLVASTAGSSVTVHLGDGAGNLAAPQRIETLPSPVAVAVADVDVNGFPDVVVAGSGGLMVHRADQGRFDVGRLPIKQSATWVDRSLRALAVEDLGGTDHPELLVLATHAGGAELWVVPGTASANERTPALLHSSPNAFSRLQVIDLNADGALDIVVWGATGDVLWGSASGGFAAEPGFIAELPARETALAFADLDKDGWPDLVSAKPVGQGTLFYGFFVRSRLWNGASFELVESEEEAFTSSDQIQLSLVDWSGDDVPDLMLRETRASYLGAYAGKGDGTFRRSAVSDIPAGGGGIAAGDLDDDGVLDLVALHRDVSALTTHHGLGQGKYASFALELPDRTYLRAAAVHRYSEQSEPVVAVIGGLDLDTGRFRVLHYDGAGAMVEDQQVPIYRPTDLQLADLNDDGQPDALITTERGLYWLAYEENGRFASEPLPLASGIRPSAAAVGDTDGDGRADLFVQATDLQEGAIHWLRRGDAGWEERDHWEIPSRSRMVAGDVTGDGLLDVVFSSSSTLSVITGATGSGLRLTSQASMPEEYYGLRLADLNGDGANEILAGDWRGYTAYEYSPDGALTQLARAATPMLFQTDTFWDVLPARLNDDDFADLVESEAKGIVALWQGVGDGRFEQLERHIVPSSLGAVSTEDLDGDGIGDLLLFGGDPYGGSLLLLPGAITCREPSEG